jgi:hypothetical protein
MAMLSIGIGRRIVIRSRKRRNVTTAPLVPANIKWEATYSLSDSFRKTLY